MDGRDELVDEVTDARDDLKDFISAGIAELMRLRDFEYGVEGALLGADASLRAAEVTVPRFEELARR